MQHDVTKHTKKIYDTGKNYQKVFAEKAKETIIEILIIAVTLSIWLHSWSEHRQKEQDGKGFLSDLKEDLNNDIKNMQSARDLLSKSIGEFEFWHRLQKIH